MICPFLDAAEHIDCIYMKNSDCEDTENCPGNSDAWCRSVIERAERTIPTESNEREILIEELWDEHSQIIENDVDSFSTWASTCAMSKEDFFGAAQKLLGKDWNGVIVKVVEIQNERNAQKPSPKHEYRPEYFSIGDIMLMIENSFIGKCDATLEDYIQGIAEYYEVNRGEGQGKNRAG